MPFDPLKPADHSPLSSAEMRGQLNALNDAIAAVPAGPPGPAGPAFSNVLVSNVTTGAPGSPASASVNVFGNNVELSFTIPQGEPGFGVTMTDVTNAIGNEISGTARNPNTVVMLGISISDPPTQGELAQVMAKLNELIAALTR